MRVSFIKSAALAVLATAALAACGGGGGGSDQSAMNLVAKVNAVSAAALTDNGEMNFPDGIADFGVAGSATLNITADAGSSTGYAFSVKQGAQEAGGDLDFGSCIFRFKRNSFAGNSLMNNGLTITVTDCFLNFSLRGPSDFGLTLSPITRLFLNNSRSTLNPNEKITIAANGGSVTIELPGGTMSAPVTVVKLTGAN